MCTNVAQPKLLVNQTINLAYHTYCTSGRRTKPDNYEPCGGFKVQLN